MPATLTAEELAADLALRDLTDGHAGPHAIQLLIDLAVDALAGNWGCDVRVERGPRVVRLLDNDDRLCHPPSPATPVTPATSTMSTSCVAMLPP